MSNTNKADDTVDNSPRHYSQLWATPPICAQVLFCQPNERGYSTDVDADAETDVDADAEDD